MSFEDQQQINLTGSLLLADPSLRDPGFGRSVVLLARHDADEGASGFIINKPLGKSVSELVTLDELEGVADVRSFIEAAQGPEARGRHMLSEPLIHIDPRGDTATATTDYAFISQRLIGGAAKRRA